MDQCQICKLNHTTEDHECYICHEKGTNSHKFLTCPNRCKFCGGSHTISGHECFVCHQTGPDSHDFLDCPEKCKLCYKFHLTKDHECIICHSKGENSHHYMKCPRKRPTMTSLKIHNTSLSMFGMFSGGSLENKLISSPMIHTSRSSLVFSKNPKRKTKADDSDELEPITPIKGILNNLKEHLDEEDGIEFVYGDMDSVMIKVSSTEEMEKLNKFLETRNNDLELVSEKSFQPGFFGKKIYLP